MTQHKRYLKIIFQMVFTKGGAAYSLWPDWLAIYTTVASMSASLMVGIAVACGHGFEALQSVLHQGAILFETGCLVVIGGDFRGEGNFFIGTVALMQTLSNTCLPLHSPTDMPSPMVRRPMGWIRVSAASGCISKTLL